MPVDIHPIHDTKAEGYPYKLCIALKNESEKHLLVRPADWEKRSPSDIDFRRIREHPWTPEGPEGWGKRHWIWSQSPGSNPIDVPKGRAIQTWVGLHEELDQIELTQRIVGKRLGTLIIPYSVDGESRTQTIKL
jgi:hypothetical protein